MEIKTAGSVCSGIEAASVALKPLGIKFEWFSEIAEFPSRVLRERYPETPNIGDMSFIPNKLESLEIQSPDLICGGTPCQAFSITGLRNGLNDDRGNLTLKFAEIADSCDKIRLSKGKEPAVILWENVEGVLTDKTNAFGCLVSCLAGFEQTLNPGKWHRAGIVRGLKRNIAWRVLDAKHFGLPQQRRRLYLLAGGKNFSPENVLFEQYCSPSAEYPQYPSEFEKEGHKFKIFRSYTDCLYSSYGTKWNGNAAAYNGSLFVVQDERIRRFSPLECERLMGFPDGYTDLSGASRTNRYKTLGNSWAVPVIKWIGRRLLNCDSDLKFAFLESETMRMNEGACMSLGKDVITSCEQFNCSAIPNICKFKSVREIISSDAPEDIYLSPVGCSGILRRKKERNLKINPELEKILISTASQMSPEDIEKCSRVQKRGKLSM